jgi:hypothetical protein
MIYFLSKCWAENVSNFMDHIFELKEFVKNYYLRPESAIIGHFRTKSRLISLQYKKISRWV